MRIIQFFDSLGYGRGGLTAAVYDRLALVPDSVPLVIAVTGEQFDVAQIFDNLKENGSIPRHATLRCFFDEQFGGADGSFQVPFLPVQSMPELCTTEPTSSGEIKRYFDHSGRFRRLERYDFAGRKTSEDIHNPDRPQEIECRIVFDLAGARRKAVWFDDSWRPRYQTYFRADGTSFASSWISEKGAKYRFVKFGRNGTATEVGYFNNLRHQWTQDLLAEQADTVAISDEPATIFALSETKKISNVRGIAVIHTVHFANNIDEADGHRGWMKYYRVGKGNIGEIIALSEVQREALARAQTGIAEASESVIPHPAPDWSMEPHEDPTHRILYLGRLHKDKGVELAIRGFSEVVKNDPLASMVIVGNGPEEGSLKELVKQLGLKGRVQFEPYTADVKRFYAEADAQVLLSKYEGLPLVLLEGFAAALPAIVTPAPFGPRELIRNEENGLVVQDNVASVSNAMARVLSDNALRLNLASNAAKCASRYSVAGWEAAWRRKLGLLSDTVDL